MKRPKAAKRATGIKERGGYKGGHTVTRVMVARGECLGVKA